MRIQILHKPLGLNALILCGALLLSACSGDRQRSAMGVFESDIVTIQSEVSGKITEILVREGESVSAGQILARIDTTKLLLQQKKLQAQLDNAAREKERLEKLYKANSATKQSVELATLQFEILSSERAILEDTLQRSEIKAPLECGKQACVVLQKYAFTSELAAPMRPLFRIANAKTMRLKAYLNAQDVSALNLGDSVVVRRDFGSDFKEYQGRISFISSEAEFTPKSIMTRDERDNLVYMLKVDVEEGEEIKIGSYGEVILSR